MPIYQFRCPNCGMPYETTTRELSHPCPCGSYYKRVFSFTPHKPAPAHFNHALGRYVSNDREFRDGLKRASEEASLNTGIDHNFTMIDPRDKKALGVTDEGLHEQAAAWSNKGLKLGQGDPNV